MLIKVDASKLPRLYSDVMDRRLRAVGTIVDIFGKVESPYAAVLCHPKVRIDVGEKVFAKQVRTHAGD